MKNSELNAERIAHYLRAMRVNALIRRIDDGEMIEVGLAPSPGYTPTTLATIMVVAGECVLDVQGVRRDINWVGALHEIAVLTGRHVPRVLSILDKAAL